MTASERPILFVEDDPNDAELTMTALTSAGLTRRVVPAADGEEARRLLDDDAFDPALVLLDLNLPKVGGLELLARIRSSQRRQGLVVVILTSSDEPSDRRRARELGADAYLLKPMSLDGYGAVAETIERLLRAEPPRRGLPGDGSRKKKGPR